jgi:hypothetical protein
LRPDRAAILSFKLPALLFASDADSPELSCVVVLDLGADASLDIGTEVAPLGPGTLEVAVNVSAS